MSRGLGDVYKRQVEKYVNETPWVLPKEAAEVDWEKKLETSKLQGDYREANYGS